jgi:hypothetical protein
MRFGMMLAAAAALVVGAGQASAATFVEYQVSGLGNLTRPFDSSPTQQPVSFAYSFVIEVDPGYSDYSTLSSGDGSTFNHGIQADAVNASVSAPNSLTFSAAAPYFAGSPTNFTVSYQADGDSTLFPRSLLSTNASGSVFFNETEKRSGYIVTGNISQFRIVGQVADFAFPTLQTYALPEPATWMMMIVGAGLIGAAARRRTRPLPLAG